MRKLFLRVHPADNVAIALPPEGISSGAEFAGIMASDFIPQAHKIVTVRIAPGEPVIRYGQVIGVANRELRPGNYAREEYIDLPDAPPLDKLPVATAIPAPLPPLEGYTFQGYRNPDGSVGTRNVLAISTTVQCTAPTVDYARKCSGLALNSQPRLRETTAGTTTAHSIGTEWTFEGSRKQ